MTHDQLLQRVWRPEKSGDVRVIRTPLRRLRLKLGEDAASPKYIFAEPRVGYPMAKGKTAVREDGPGGRC